MYRINNKYFALVVIVIAMLLLTNCKDDDSNPTSTPGLDEQLIGKWNLVEAFVPSMNITVTAEQIGIILVASFVNDGKYEISTTDSTGIEVETGTWSTEGGVLLLKVSDGSEETIPYTINGDEGILKSSYEIQEGVSVPADFKFVRM